MVTRKAVAEVVSVPELALFDMHVNRCQELDFRHCFYSIIHITSRNQDNPAEQIYVQNRHVNYVQKYVETNGSRLYKFSE